MRRPVSSLRLLFVLEPSATDAPAGIRTRVRASLHNAWQGPIIATRSPARNYLIFRVILKILALFNGL